MSDEILSAPETDQAQPIEQEEGQTPTGNNGSVEEVQGSPETPQAEVPSQTKDGAAVLAPENLPEDASAKDKDYAKQMMRYFTLRTQSMSEEKTKAQQLDRVMASEDWKAFENFRQTRQPQEPPQAQPKPVDPTMTYLQREFDDAYQSGDSQKMFQVQTELQRHIARSEVNEKARNVEFWMQKQEKAQRDLQGNMILEEFGKLHPDFWDYHRAGIAVPILRDFEAQGKGLEEAYQHMRSIADSFRKESIKQQQVRIQEKKAAVTNTPTPPQESEFIDVDSREEADRMNLQFAFDRSPKVARFRKKA